MSRVPTGTEEDEFQLTEEEEDGTADDLVEDIVRHGWLPHRWWRRGKDLTIASDDAARPGGHVEAREQFSKGVEFGVADNGEEGEWGQVYREVRAMVDRRRLRLE